MEKTFK